MGTPGDEAEFNGVFCSCWQAAGLGRAVIGLVVWGAAAGVWSERLGADAAVVLRSGQQVKLRLWGLKKGDNKTLMELNWCKKEISLTFEQSMESYRTTTQIRLDAFYENVL